MSTRERVAAALYDLLWLAAAPLVAVYLLWRARRQPAYRARWGERFLGRYAETPSQPCLWVHAVSVGETRAAAPLVERLVARYPAYRVLVTHMTPTGLETARALFGERVSHALLAYDLPFARRAFVAHWRPTVGVVMETEIWPGLLRTARAGGVPIVLANARMSERSMRGALRWTALMRPAVRAFARVLAQTRDDAVRLATIAAEEVDAPRYAVTGNMKFDVPVPEAQRRLAREFGERLGRPTVLCASTRDGEEGAIVDAWARRGRKDLVLVVVPRHPQRFDEVAAIVARAGLASQRRSDGRPVAATTDVWLGDSMGELLAYYLAAGAAYVGGSLVPLGGQNLIEAAAAGCPVVVGPHTFNFADATEAAIRAGAAVRVSDVDDMLDAATAIVADAPRSAAMRAAGIAFAAAHGGATARTLDAIAPFVGHA